MADQKITELTALTTPADEDLLAIVDDPSGTPQTKKATRQNLFNAWDGWVPANETWTYASATTFTVSGDVTAKYPKGTKIKLTQTTVKYFYVVGATYSAPNTTVTVTGGSDYSLANAAITNNFYSYVEQPQGFPGYFNWTPSYSATGSMTYTSVTTDRANFQIKGNWVFYSIQAYGTTGGTASNGLIFTNPVSATGSLWLPAGAGEVIDADDRGAFALVNGGDTTKINTYKYDGSNFGLGASRYIKIIGFYPYA